MAEHTPPTLPTLVQGFFPDHLGEQRAVSAQTVAAYRDTLRLLLLLNYAAAALHRIRSAITLNDLDAPLLLAFLDHLERDRGNSVRSRNARLAAIRTFLKYASHHDLASLATIERALAIPFKRFDRPMVGFLSRTEIRAILEAPDRLSCFIAHRSPRQPRRCNLPAREFPRMWGIFTAYLLHQNQIELPPRVRHRREIR